jgi:hypothetical protein
MIWGLLAIIGVPLWPIAILLCSPCGCGPRPASPNIAAKTCAAELL